MSAFPADTYTGQDIAAALGVTPRAVRKRATLESWAFADGKARRYLAESLPLDVRRALVAGLAAKAAQDSEAAFCADKRAHIEAAWCAYQSAKGWRKRIAERRHDALLALAALLADGVSLREARSRVAIQLEAEGVTGGVSSLKRWGRAVREVPRAYWLAFLLPEEKGRPQGVEIHPQAWAAFKRDWLRLEQPAAESCYRRLQRIAAQHPEWLPLPSLKTLGRRIQGELPAGARVLAREGVEALMRMGPQLRRDRSLLAAMQVVNADGHRFDVAVRYPDDSTGRPLILGWQDVYSGKLLAYRIARSETADVVRLSFCDMVEKYGIPGRAHLDNGRAFAAKTNTGGVPTRYRYKVKEDDQLGVITRLGVSVHWVTPYNGKAKPIERAWRDVAGDISKRPEFAGAYLGSNPAAKPENYGSRAVPWELFLSVVADGVAEFNARVGRTGGVADGRSFDQVFAESYANTTVKRATREQLAMLLLASSVVVVNRERAHVTLAGNRYWHEPLCKHMGQSVELRFDPAALHSGVHVFALSGDYICFAPCEAAIGHDNSEAARNEIRRQREWLKRHREFLKADQARNAAAPSDLRDIPVPDLPTPAATALLIPLRRPAASDGGIFPSDAAPVDFDPVFLDRMRELRRNGP